MSHDLRRFDYPLEPVRRQGLWRLDALRASLGAIQREIESEERRVEELRQQHASQSRIVANASVERLDPVVRAGLLNWLVELRRRIHQGEQFLAELGERRKEAAGQYDAQRRKVEAVQQHREDSIYTFVQEEMARSSSEADRDWLARLHWASINAADVGDGEEVELAP